MVSSVALPHKIVLVSVERCRNIEEALKPDEVSHGRKGILQHNIHPSPMRVRYHFPPVLNVAEVVVQKRKIDRGEAIVRPWQVDMGHSNDIQALERHQLLLPIISHFHTSMPIPCK